MRRDRLLLLTSLLAGCGPASAPTAEGGLPAGVWSSYAEASAADCDEVRTAGPFAKARFEVEPDGLGQRLRFLPGGAWARWELPEPSLLTRQVSARWGECLVEISAALRLELLTPSRFEGLYRADYTAASLACPRPRCVLQERVTGVKE